MILLIDSNNKKIKLYTDSGSKTFNFEDVNKLRDYVKGNFLYVISATSMGVDDLLKFISINFPNTVFNKTEEKVAKSTVVKQSLIPKIEEDSYVRYVGKKGRNGKGGGLYIGELDINFENVFDFKPLRYLNEKGFSKSSQVKNLIDSKLLEVLPYSEMIKKIERLEKEAGIYKKKEIELDDIIVPTDRVNVSKYMDSIDNSGGGPQDVIDIEVSGGGFKEASSNENTLVTG